MRPWCIFFVCLLHWRVSFTSVRCIRLETEKRLSPEQIGSFKHSSSQESWIRRRSCNRMTILRPEDLNQAVWVHTETHSFSFARLLAHLPSDNCWQGKSQEYVALNLFIAVPALQRLHKDRLWEKCLHLCLNTRQHPFIITVRQTSDRHSSASVK